MNKGVLNALYESDELYHYGVIGMHWGVRRYQPYGKGGYDPEHKGRFIGTVKQTRRGYQKALNKLGKQESEWDAETLARSGYSTEYGRRSKKALDKGNEKKAVKNAERAEVQLKKAEDAKVRSDEISREKNRILAQAVKDGYDVVETIRKDQVTPASYKGYQTAMYVASAIATGPAGLITVPVLKRALGPTYAINSHSKQYKVTKRKGDKPSVTTVVGRDKKYLMPATIRSIYAPKTDKDFWIKEAVSSI